MRRAGSVASMVGVKTESLASGKRSWVSTRPCTVEDSLELYRIVLLDGTAFNSKATVLKKRFS